MRKLFILSSIWSLVLLFTACKPDGQYREIKNAQWKREEPLEFEKEITENKTPYKIVLAMRYIARIPLKELKLKLQTTAPSGKVDSRDVIINLKDAKGMHIGKVMGDIGDIDTVVEEKYSFTETGKYKFAVSQDYASEMGGIQEIGLRINPVK